MKQQEGQDVKRLLDEFEAAIGQPFKLVGHPQTKFCTGMRITDTVAGVDRKYETVIGKEYGDFHVSLVQLVQAQPAQLKKPEQTKMQFI